MQKVKQVMGKLSGSSGGDSPRTAHQQADGCNACATNGTVVQQEFFTKTEDRLVVKEVVELVKEHRPVEKEFVVETRATGVEREVVEGRFTEILGTTERVVAVTPPKSPCA
ncbi:cold-regulated 1 [Chlorella sorokiniana]|uniref:Cold-regulated 1 n=1 Tax=Chlorella sorokiniana TaxID=3076 RepID=A0A2P6TGZ8_CHLSO|nr:cold-regulated 1 [Chlorella sorokiniana]|eukprot:PRW33569.1 cold-regulated 1 [Chlorella sorokiniana]